MKRFLNVSLFLLIAVSLFAKSDGKEQLSAIQNKYKSVNDFSVNFQQSVNNKAGASGKLMYARGNKVRVELKNMTIISDGKSLWNYNAGKKQVVINNADGENQSFFTVDNFINQYPSKCNVSSEDDNGKSVLVLTPNKNSGLDFKKARIWAGQDNLITRISVENQTGTLMNIELSGYDLNKNIPDSKFSFSPPEGIKVIDLRK